MPDTRRTLSALQTLLADNTSGDISAQDARDVLVSEHPENTVQTSAYASPPSTPLTGDLWLPNNSFYAERYSGSSFVPWGPIFPLTKPVNGDFSDIGSPTVSTTNGGIVLSTASNGGSYSYKGRKKNAPSTPYTIVGGFLLNAGIINTGIAEAGLVFGDGTKYSSLAVQFAETTDTAFILVDNMTNATSFSSEPFAEMWASRGGSLVFMAIADNGTNRKYGISADGQNWYTLYSVSRTTHLTATEVGFHVNGYSMAVTSTCLHWKEVASDLLP